MNEEEALEFLSKKDAILENPNKFSHDPDKRKEIEVTLINGYQGAIEFLFELGTWLTYIDEDAQSTRNIIESVVMETIIQNYDRSKAISCLTDDNLSATMEWLSQMIESPTWRKTIYELAQNPRNEDCPFLSLAMPCIAVKDTLIGELISVPLAWNTLEIYLKCACYVLQPLISAGDYLSEGIFGNSVAFLQPEFNKSDSSTASINKTVDLGYLEDVITDEKINENEEKREVVLRARQLLPSFLEMGCYSEHGYLILQSLLQCLDRKTKGHSARKLSWILEAEAMRRNKDISRYSIYFCGARDYPDSMESMKQILKEKSLISSSIDQLYKAYRKDVCPPVALLLQPVFITLLADALFASSDRLLSEQQDQYAFFYAYAAVTLEDVDLVSERCLSSDSSKLDETKKQIIEASNICRQWSNMSGSGISVRAFRDLPSLLACIPCRPVSFGVFRFLRVIFRTKRVDFELNLDTMKPYCIVANEIATCNQQLHSALLVFVTELIASAVEGMEDLSQLEYKRMLVGLLVHLVTCGHVIPVILTVRKLFERSHVDVSLVRYFVVELLYIAAPPYNKSFLNALYPLVSEPDISDGLKAGKDSDFVNEFIDICEKEFDSCEDD